MYSEMIWQFDLYYICRNDLRDLERAYSFFGKFLVWSFDPKIFRFQPNFIAYFIFRCLRSIPVSKSFHRLLGVTDGRLSFFMDMEHLVCEVCARLLYSDTTWLDAHTGMMTHVAVKWGCPGTCMHTIIVCELCNANPFWPVYLSIMSEDPQERFNTLVLTFCLAICLRMVRRGQFCFYSKHFI